jgi:phenylacetate-CoA ligase
MSYFFDLVRLLLICYLSPAARPRDAAPRWRLSAARVAAADYGWAWLAQVLRWITLRDQRAFLLLALPQTQPLLRRMQRAQAYAVYRRAQRECPAYRDFLDTNPHPPIRDSRDLGRLPSTTKANYVTAYRLEARCYGGRIPNSGVVLDESSGSSGNPNTWVRGPIERDEVRRGIRQSFRLMFGDGPYVLLNCFALGPWATGMIVSQALAEEGILKSIGPDQAKLEQTLELFGPNYRYIVLGYPPFIKNLVDTTRLSLRDYQIAAIVGGEGMSEAMRAHLEQHLDRVVSSYGASDLEINLGSETELAISVRRRCANDPTLCQALFGREMPPMIFQTNPLEYLIETNEVGELLFTICRLQSAAPKVRYNLRDSGGVMSFSELSRRLALRGIAIESLAGRCAHAPFLYVFGRADMSVPFYGSKVFPADIEQVLSEQPLLANAISSFQISSDEDTQLNRRLTIHLELLPDGVLPFDMAQLRDLVIDGLARCNRDFREAARFAARERVCVELHPHRSGRFAGQDARIKRQYIS